MITGNKYQNTGMQYSKGFTGSANSAFAPVQTVQKSSANAVAPNCTKIAPFCTSILSVEISCFANYQSTLPKPVNLLSWLKSDKYAKQVDLIRKEPDKEKRNELKAKLPAITPSGTFTERSLKGLIKHSGFIQFDIDGVPDIQAVKAKICTLANVAYCGLSVSGLGLWGLIPIAEPEHHTYYFTFIQKVFAGMGITIDNACKDVSRLRGYSYDADAYFNHSAKPLQKWFNPVPKQPYKRNYGPISGNDNASKVDHCLREIRAKGIDLTPTYEAWFKIGCSLAGEFGETGRDYFHSVSQYHPKYNFQDTDKQFNHCLRHRYSTTIATFFAACRDAGIMFQTGLIESKKSLSPVYPESSHSKEFTTGLTGLLYIPLKPIKPDVPQPTRVQSICTLKDLFQIGNEDAALFQSGAITREQWFVLSDKLQKRILASGFTLKEYVKFANQN